MKKLSRSIYDDVSTFVVRHVDTRLFGTNNFHFRGVLFDWDLVYEAFERYWGYEEMSRKKKVTRYFCKKCKHEICLAERILRIGSHGIPLCTSCSIRFKKCPKCSSLMVKRGFKGKPYWYCKGCVRGYPISVEEGDKV